MSAYTEGHYTSSQLTLVDSSVYGTSHTFAWFSQDDMRNALVYNDNDELLYTIETDSRALQITTLYSGDRVTVLAEVERRILRRDRIQFRSDKWIPLKNFLHGSNRKWQDL